MGMESDLFRDSAEQLIVIGMRADPEPHEPICAFYSQRAVVAVRRFKDARFFLPGGFADGPAAQRPPRADRIEIVVIRAQGRDLGDIGIEHTDSRFGP